MKFKYIVLYENSLDEFHIGHYRINGLPLTTIQTVRCYKSTLVQAYIKHLCSSDINI